MRGSVRFHRGILAPLLLAALSGVVPVKSADEPKPTRRGLFPSSRDVFPPHSPDRAQYDRWGRVVLDDTGRRINYPGPGGPESEERRRGTPRREVPEPSAVGLPIALQWHRSTFGIGIGFAGLHAVDLDGDGIGEIVATAITGYRSDSWYVLDFHEGQYVHTWTSGVYPAEIQSLRITPLDSDAAPEILVGSGNRIYVYDGVTRALEATLTTSAQEIRALQIADIDGDGQTELVFCDERDLFVADAVTGATRWLAAGLGGQDVAVGNVDDDPALEIVVGKRWDDGYVVDGISQAVEWVNPWGFGHLVRLADLDGDGRQEVVSGSGNAIRIFDVEIQSLAASVPVFDLGALRIADVEGDGPVELVYGDNQWGGIHVLDGSTRTEKWSVPNPDHGITDIAVGDVDGDAVTELIWGAGYSSSGADHLHVADAATHEREWQSLDINGPFLALSYGDVDADGRSEFLHGSFESDSGYAGGVRFVHDALTAELEYQSAADSFPGSALWRIRNADVDADPQQEIFVGRAGFDGSVTCYDGLTHAVQWQVTSSGVSFYSLSVADVENDGQLEVVAGGYSSYSSPGIFVNVLDAATGAVKWQTPNLGGAGQPSLLRVANVDGDANPEIVVAAYRDAVYVLDGVTHTIQNLGDHAVTALETPDRDGNGVGEIVVGTEGGALEVLDAFNGAVVQSIGTYPGPIDGLAVADVTGDSVPDYVFGVNDEVYIYDGAAPDRLRWRSGLLGDAVGYNDSLFIADVDADGSLELVVSLGYAGFRVYEAAPLTLTIGDASVAEGDSGQTMATFTITLSAASAQVVTVHYSTADGTATSGSDYLPVSGILGIPAGATAGVVSVPVLGDLGFDGDETFSVVLSAAGGAAILDGEATGLILEDEPGPGISIDDVTVAEGGTAWFTVTLSPPNLSEDVSVNYQITGGTATAGRDFVPASGPLWFYRGNTSITLPASVKADTVIDGGETFHVTLSNATHAVIADPQGTATILDGPVPGDFDGSGRTDILWRDHATGHVAAWFMDGTTKTGGTLITPSPFTPLSWKIVGTADFNGDGKTDILWRDQTATGQIAVWYMDGTTRTAAVLTNPAAYPLLDWRIVGTGDFSDDGKPDILWRDQAKTGQIAVWFMNGTTRTMAVLTNPGSFPLLNWEIVGVGDFNDDGKPDILWRDTKSTGKLAVWFMSGTTRIGAVLVTPDAFPLLNWEIQGVGDFDADGHPDILWRDQTGTGKIAVWFMDGTAMSSSTLTSPDAFPLLNWRIVGPK